MKKNMTMSASCLFGLESVVKFELGRIGAENITSEDGRVTFQGDEQVLIKANLWLRSAERISIVLGSFKALTFTELFDNVERLPFEEFIGENDEFPVKGWSLSSQLASVPSCQSIIKKAAVTRLGKVYGVERFSEIGPRHQIAFSLHKDVVTIMLDTSGEALFKRGYRKSANIAPIRETLAAGIVDFSRVRSDSVVYDPMCGSGTLVIEAAQKALNIAPGLLRSFQVEEWAVSSKVLWKEERELAKATVDKDAKFKGFGYDIDEKALQVARENARLAGVGQVVTFEKADINDLSVDSGAIILCNPPYGERLMEKEDALSLYSVMGKVMVPKPDVSYNIIAPAEDFEREFGKKADKRRKLYNGMLQCNLHMYFR